MKSIWFNIYFIFTRVGSKKKYESHLNEDDPEPSDCTIEHFQLLARYATNEIYVFLGVTGFIEQEHK